MRVFKVTYEMSYPGSEDDIREAYVLADDFREAQVKVEKAEKGKYETAYIKKIEILDAKIIV